MEGNVKRLVPELISRLRSGVALTCVPQCVEELVLNAIDAEATCTAVRLDLNFGKIQVIDNGHGIPRKHLDLIGERYVTSKCHTIEDLSNLKYHGFRGEALASLRDVSAMLEITTRVAEASHTYCKSFHFGKIGKTLVSASPRPGVGTTVTALDFLYNFPVRKNLTSEARNVEDCRQRLECIALMHPTVSFSLRDDSTGDIALQTRKCSTILGTFTFLFGQPRTQNMKNMDYAWGKLRLQGLLSTESCGSKEIQFLYVNRRRVVKTGLHKIVKSALGKYLFQRKQTQSPGKGLPQHPNYVLNLSCPLDGYDVCFEPQKTMIEFVHWEEVARFIEEATANFARLHELEEAHPESCRKRVSGEDAIEDVEDASREYGVEITTENTKNALHSLAVKRTKTSSETLAIDACKRSIAIRSADPKENEQHEMSRIKLIKNLDINLDAEEMCYSSSLDRLKRKVERLKKQEETENKTSDSSARSPSESRSVRLGNKCGRISRGRDLGNLKEFQFDRRRKTLSRSGASDDRISTSPPQTKKTNPTGPISKKQQNVSEIVPSSKPLATFYKINTTKIAASDKTEESTDKTNSFASKADCHQMGGSKSLAFSAKINILENASECYQKPLGRPRPTSRVAENAWQVSGDNVPDISQSETECALINRTSNAVGIVINSSSVEEQSEKWSQITSMEKDVLFSSHGFETNNYFINESQTSVDLSSLDVAISDEVSNKKDTDTIYSVETIEMLQIEPLPAERPRSRSTTQDLESCFKERDRISRLETSKETILPLDEQKQNSVTNGLDIDNGSTKANRASEESNGKVEGWNAKRAWIPYEDGWSGNTIYINAETGNSSYDPPMEPSSLTADDARKEDESMPLTHFALSHDCNPFLPRPISERPVFDGVQNSNEGQISSMLKKWTNPTFRRTQEVSSITPSGPSKTSAVKVYNTLQQYRFEKTHLRHVKFVGQVDCKFIACLMSYQDDDNLLVLFDQHAVHERIRLEKFVEELFEDKPEGQRIIKTDIKPAMVLEVEHELARRAKMYSQQISEWGTDVSVVSQNSLEVHSVPTCLTRKGYPNQTVVQNLVTEQLQTLHETGCLSTLPKTLLDILSSRACHGAIKFGDPLDSDKAKEMIKSLSNCKLPFQCAHGRPSLAPILDLRHLPKVETDEEMENLDRLKMLE